MFLFLAGFISLMATGSLSAPVDADWQCSEHLYSFHSEPVSYANAEKLCTSLGASLPILKNQLDAARFAVLQSNHTGDVVPLGLRFNDAKFDKSKDGREEGAWLWSDGSVADFTAWAVGEPDDDVINHNVYAFPKGDWQDGEKRNSPVICQRLCSGVDQVQIV